MNDNKKRKKKPDPETGKRPPREPITPQVRDEEREKRLQEAFEENVRRCAKIFEALS